MAAQILVGGEWTDAVSDAEFTAANPSTGEQLPEIFPISSWDDCDRALDAAVAAARALRAVSAEARAAFLEGYAAAIEADADRLVATAHAETGLAVKPRLSDVELPRTTTQLRQAAAAAREGSWQAAVLDTKANIRSHFAPIGPVVVFGPNNFPFAFNGISGGDFAAAIAVGCPVLAKAHPLHPATSRLLAACAHRALKRSELPPGTVQMLYNVSNEDGLRLVADSRVGASSFTGSRSGGLRLKAAADAAGKPMYLEMSSLNPVVLLPGALTERWDLLATELADSCLAAAGQFCTSPNLILALAGESAERLTSRLAETLAARPSAALLSHGGVQALDAGVRSLIQAGAEVVTGASIAPGDGFRYRNTLLRVSAQGFLAQSEPLQREAFGNATTLILARDLAELVQVVERLEGNLTGSIHSATTGADDAIYTAVAEALRPRVGRLLNDKMPTGVALSPAMNHGGPFPSTSHPGFTSVGIPRSLQRFGALQCYDNVREDRLPPVLRDRGPAGMWRSIDGSWVRG